MGKDRVSTPATNSRQAAKITAAPTRSYCNYDPEAEFNDGSCAPSRMIVAFAGEMEAAALAARIPSHAITRRFSYLMMAAAFTHHWAERAIVKHSLSIEGELGPGETESIAVSGFGYVAAVTVFLHFENTQQDMTRASDLSIIVEAPDGTCKQIGGFDVDFGCTSSGFWPSSWQSTADGDYVGSSDNWKCA